MKELLNTFAGCLFILSAFFFGLWIYEMKLEVNSLHEKVEALERAQRPLVIVDGKYPYIAVTKDDIWMVAEHPEKNKEYKK